METLIAEDLLLLLLDDDKGTVPMGTPEQTVLGGALLVELAIAGAVTVEEKRSMWRSAKVHAEPGAAPTDPVLRTALATIAEKDRSAQELVDRLGKGLKDPLVERLVDGGLLERRSRRSLGVFKQTRLLPADGGRHESDVRRQLEAVLVSGATPDERTGGIVALLSAIGRAERVVDHRGMPARQVRKRAKELARGDWAAKAVRDAIEASAAAVVAATTVATTAATTASTT